MGLRMFQSIRHVGSDVSWSVIHPNDTFDGRSVLDEFRSEAGRIGSHFVVADSRADAERSLRSGKFDIAFVCGWYWKLTEAELSLVPLGYYGIHNSLLPKYRGGAPLVWAIISGETEVGSTLFRLTEGLDDGDIALQIRVPVGQEVSVGEVMATIEDKAVAEVPAIWKKIVDGTVALSKQDAAHATYCGQRTPEDGCINWNVEARSVHNFIRAQMHPYPGAFSTVSKQKITFGRTAIDPRTYLGTPGQIVERMPDFVVITCGNSTAIRVYEIDGRPASEILRTLKTRL